jgi:hypothetical protein
VQRCPEWRFHITGRGTCCLPVSSRWRWVYSASPKHHHRRRGLRPRSPGSGAVWFGEQRGSIRAYPWCEPSRPSARRLHYDKAPRSPGLLTGTCPSLRRTRCGSGGRRGADTQVFNSENSCTLSIAIDSNVRSPTSRFPLASFTTSRIAWNPYVFANQRIFFSPVMST